MNMAIYSLSDSDTVSEKDSDEENLLLSLSSPLFKKPRSEVNNGTKKSQSPTKATRVYRKTDEEKQRALEKKQKEREEKSKMKAEKRMKSELEKAEKKKQSELEKAAKKKQSELLKQIKPGECIKSIIAYIDNTLINDYKFGGEILTALRNSEVKYQVREQVAHTIEWKRNIEELPVDDSIPNHVVTIWQAEEFINLILSDNLKISVRDLLQKFPQHRLTLVIFEIEEYFKLRKNLQNKELRTNIAGEPFNHTEKLTANLSQGDVDMAVTTLEYTSNVQFRFLEKSEEVALFVAQFTKAMAELPYKLQRNKNLESLEWFAEADSRGSVRVDENGNGLSRLWQQQLCQFPGLGIEAAQSIVSVYPSPLVLTKAYESCSKEKGEKLLQDINIRRGQGPLSSVRRLGPELSKKIYNFFTSKDGQTLLKEN